MTGAPEDWMDSHPGLSGIQTEEDGRSWLSFRERMAGEEGRREGLSQALNIAKGCHDYGGGYRDTPELLAAFHHGMDTVARTIQAKIDNPNDTQVVAIETFNLK